MQRREYPRKPVAFASELLFKNTEVHCNIIDISVGGAKLKFTEEQEKIYPSTAVLNIIPFGSFMVTIAWHSGENMGIKFHDAPDKMAEILIAMAVY